jgi:hypothetical protein
MQFILSIAEGLRTCLAGETFLKLFVNKTQLLAALQVKLGGAGFLG